MAGWLGLLAGWLVASKLKWQAKGQARGSTIHTKRAVRRCTWRLPQSCTVTLRFCRARQFDVAKTVALVREVLAWRAQQNIAQILSEPLPVDMPTLQRAFPHGCFGKDRTGRPVRYECFGRIVPEQLFGLFGEGQAGRDGALRYAARICQTYQEEHFPAATAANNGEPVYDATVVIDLKGLTLQNFKKLRADKFLEQFAHVLSTCYPECMYKCFVINAPKLIEMISTAVSVFLDKVRSRAGYLLACYGRRSPAEALLLLSAAHGGQNHHSLRCALVAPAAPRAHPPLATAALLRRDAGVSPQRDPRRGGLGEAVTLNVAS